MADEVLPESERKQWVQFGETKGTAAITSISGSSSSTPSVIVTPSISSSTPSGQQYATIEVEQCVTPIKTAAPLHEVSLDENVSTAGVPSSVTTTSQTRQSHSNGDVIVSLLPLNTRFPWITPAQFRPELVPEELMASSLTLTVEEYVQGMELLVNDVRFNLYNVFYKRILVLWIFLGFIILLAILFTTPPGLRLFGAGVLWLVINAVTIFFCMYAKIKMNRELERCVAGVNRIFVKHNILLGVDDRGHLSCHKVNLCFIYFNAKPCIERLGGEVSRHDSPVSRDPATLVAAASVSAANHRRRMDIDDSDIIITGTHNKRISRQQDRSEKLLLRYSQRWCKDYLRKRLDWTVNMSQRLESGGASAAASGATCVRHLSTARCPCQYIEDHLSWKPSPAANSSLTCCGLQPPEFCANYLC